MSNMQDFEESSTLFGSNVPFIEEQYEIYLANPGAVSADWRRYFQQLGGTRTGRCVRDARTGGDQRLHRRAHGVPIRPRLRQ